MAVHRSQPNQECRMKTAGTRRNLPQRPAAAGALALALVALTACGAPPDEAPKVAVTAIAEIRACGEQEILGTATFRERASTEGIKLVDVDIEVRGLSDGRHAVHVHETGACEPCGAAGGHHDPGPFGKSTPDAPDFNHPFHGGDLLNLESSGGVATLRTTSSRFTLSAGRLSVFDEDGSALIVHSNPDEYCDQEDELAPGCAGGARDACGVLTLE